MAGAGTGCTALSHLSSRLVPSPADTANRCRPGQDLLLNRTMLSDHESPYEVVSPATGIDLQPQTPQPIRTSLRTGTRNPALRCRRPRAEVGPLRLRGLVDDDPHRLEFQLRDLGVDGRGHSVARGWRACRGRPRTIRPRALIGEERSITAAGCPSAALRFTSRPPPKKDPPRGVPERPQGELFDHGPHHPPPVLGHRRRAGRGRSRRRSVRRWPRSPRRASRRSARPQNLGVAGDGHEISPSRAATAMGSTRSHPGRLESTERVDLGDGDEDPIPAAPQLPCQQEP